MAEPKTQKTKDSVATFLAGVEDETRRKDAKTVAAIFRDITGEKPAMWGTSIVGYGSYESPTGTWMRVGFSPRKTSLVLYVLAGFAGAEALLKKLGKHKTGKGCLYVAKLADVDEGVLRDIVRRSWEHMAAKYG